MTRALLLVLVACLSCMAAANAHTVSVARMDLSLQAGGAVRMEVDISLRDLALAYPLDADRNERVTWGELLTIGDAVKRDVLRKVRLEAGGAPCAMRPSGLGTRSYDDGTYAVLRFQGTCRDRDRVVLKYGLFEEDRQHRAFVTVRAGAGVSTVIASIGGGPVLVGSAAPAAFPQFFREGVHHILIGYDHMAFLLSLLLTAVLVRTAGHWQPRPRLRGSLMHVAGIVTAFTAAHSATLSLSALGWVRPASQWVEATIALSVMLAAVNNLRPLVARRLWLVAFGFGLIHGFGFAGALGELGLPRTARLQALLGFNLGVEAGQLALVLVALPLLHAVRRHAWYLRTAMPALSLAIAALAGWWLYQRIAG